jgi:hypothetical protein
VSLLMVLWCKRTLLHGKHPKGLDYLKINYEFLEPMKLPNEAKLVGMQQ